MLRAAVFVLALSPAIVVAGDLETQLTEHAAVDWSRAEVRARGSAPADLRAPSPAVARTKALRQAVEQARGRLAAAIVRLPRANGSRVEKLDQRALAQILDSAAVVDRSFGSDGSAMVNLAIGTEAVRAALEGPLAPGKSKVATIWVDARGLDLEPAVGVVVSAGGVRYQGPTVFYSSETATRKDRRIARGKSARRTTGRMLVSGSVELDGIDESELRAAASGSPLLVFLIKKARTSR
ncbi:MAG: hypothetical protein KJO07_11220 [Deltaproteobacteria bacterium]|nr:hypothetical protein [Deltaproteobacteria bacterium]